MNHTDSQGPAFPRPMASRPGKKPSFRGRHPRLFWLGVLVAVLLLWFLVAAFLDHADRTGMFSGPRFGVLRVEGPIADAEDFVAWAARLRDDSTIAGVLLRIDSPGGAVTPSQEMYSAVKRLAAKKPVVVSMGTAGASGGYYIAVAGQAIFANPSTLTGSIGVRLQLANVEGLMDRIGIRTESFATGALKAAGSPFHTMTEQERAYLEGLIHDMQEEFVSVVAENRKMPLEAVRSLADGRAFTGRQALEVGLIDALGDSEDALERLGELTGLPVSGTDLVEAPEPSKALWREFVDVMLDLEEARSISAPAYKFYF